MAASDEMTSESGRGRTSVRSYLAGTGASGSLLAAAAVAFVAVTAFVAFDGVPLGDGGPGADALALEDAGTVELVAPAAAAAAVADAPGAVAAAPPPGAAAPTDGALLAAIPGGGPAPDPGDGPPSGAPDPFDPIGITPPGGPGSCADGTAPPCNPVNEAAASVDDAAEGTVGTNPNLGEATQPVTDAVDQVLEQTTGKDLGGHVDGLVGGRTTLPD